MGGTFDPIHCGHLLAAEEARRELALDLVVFVPSGTPPHRSGACSASAEDRYAMTLLAIAGNDHFDISRAEIERGGVSYTADTLRAMRDVYEDAELFFITGADAVLEFGSWREPREILRLCTLVAVARPGYDYEDVERLGEELGGAVSLIKTSSLDISATGIRNRLADGRGAKYLTPGTVIDYIKKKNLYTALDGELR
ncbi:putative nicotinate-nucleotide adenylyltransferase [Synergistales bacterium]|nr:putative nicotinate-nucleotide adenylyltransferase [Synergistales bacterium]